MESVVLKAFRFKSEGEIATEVMLAQMKDNNLTVEAARKKVRVTQSLTISARPIELNSKRRCLGFTVEGKEFVVHSKDVLVLLRDQGFVVTDTRVK